MVKIKVTNTLKYYRVNSNGMTIVNEIFGQATVVHTKFGPFTYCIFDFNSTLKVGMW